MKYNNIIKGKFIKRPNRFIAIVEIDGKEEKSHVKNTGRCKELLIPNATIYLQDHSKEKDFHKSKRKTKYSLIAVEKGNLLINMDSQIPNAIWEEWLKNKTTLPDIDEKTTLIKREYTYKNSRLDFYLETENKKILMEVKGVTLEKDGIALFPDAPTERGIKHINHLIQSISEGFIPYIIFIIQMKGIKYFTPNNETSPAFVKTLQEAQKAGVHILAYDSIIKPDEIVLDKIIPVKL